MKTLLCSLLLLLSFAAVAQTTPYQSVEVDSVAEPRGGITLFNTFIQANLRKPIPAEAAGKGGRVIVTGIVEADGRISDVKALQGFRPDCSREAVRVFELFNAWKPAQKNGQAVRQQITMPILFQPNEPFVYTNGFMVSYLDADSKVMPDSSRARYKQTTPMDSTGFPTGDIVVYEAKKSGWKEALRLPLVRRTEPNIPQEGGTVKLVGHQTKDLQWEGLLLEVDENGNRVNQTYYQNGEPVGNHLTYYPNGVLAEKDEDYKEKKLFMNWYPNGQMKQIRVITKWAPDTQPVPEQVTAYWDSTGRQLVKDGNGQTVYHTNEKSLTHTSQRTDFVEQGMYANNFKQGVWTGRYADGSYSYEEQYDKGVNLGGKAQTAGSAEVQYKAFEQQAEFKGGMQALGKFLAQNLRYPPDAQRSRVQGRVIVGFVIGIDGDVEDVKVEKGLGFGTNEEAERVVKASTGQWTPGTKRGRKVPVKFRLPINFSVQ